MEFGAENRRDAEASRATAAVSDSGARIEWLRLRSGISRQQLADRCGLSRQQLWRVVRGRSALTGDVTRRIAAALDVSPREIVGTTSRRPALRRRATGRAGAAAPSDLASYLASPAALAATFATLPACADGRAMRSAFAAAIAAAAVRAGLAVPSALLALDAAPPADGAPVAARP